LPVNLILFLIEDYFICVNSLLYFLNMVKNSEINILEIDAPLVTDVLQQFLAEEVYKCGFERVVLGLSGGIDSAIVAFLCARSFSPSQVTALIMPYHTSNPQNIKHAKQIADRLGINYEKRDITSVIDTFFSNDPEADLNRRGNRMARERMCHIYDFSSKYQALPIGTSNKTELLLGYGTIYGDLASAINPIGDLYKTQVWQLGKYLGVPEEILSKTPSADLWKGQTDEKELGYSYKDLDNLLFYLVDQRYSETMLKEIGFASDMIKNMQNRIQKSQFKRRPPVIAKLSNRTINQDFRYCRDWGV
jgi:NAD+ synthase